jgi:STE24 endopeptidase
MFPSVNLYGYVILGALLANYAVELVAELLNIRALRPGLPAGMEGTYDAGAYRNSQEYTRARTKFGLVRQSVDLALLLAFWFLGGFNRLDVLLRGRDIGVIWRGLLFIGALLLLRTLLSLPFAIYATFVIEEEFGFNKTTPATFALDLLKGALLAVLLGGPLLAAVLAIFQYAGPGAWLYGWLAVSAFMLVLQFVAPAWIMPLFNTFTPLEEGELKQRILAYAKSVDFSLENIFTIDGSRRSSKSNAFFTGFGKHKRIALFDTLIAQQTTPELVAVLAHEIGHYKKRHILQGTAVSIAHLGAMLCLLSLFLTHRGLFEAFSMEHLSVYGGLIFFSLLLTPVEMILAAALNILSRRNEYEADRFAAETTKEPEQLIGALKKLSVKNLANLTPHPFLVFLHYSHPPLLERVRALSAETGWSPPSTKDS